MNLLVEKVVMVGDCLFIDVLVGNCLGMFIIFVEFIFSNGLEFFNYKVCFFEVWVF